MIDDQLDVKLPMLIRLQDLWDWSNRKQTPHKQKHTLVAIKQEKENQKLKKKERFRQDDLKDQMEMIQNIFEYPYKVFTQSDKWEENDKLTLNRQGQRVIAK